MSLSPARDRSSKGVSVKKLFKNSPGSKKQASSESPVKAQIRANARKVLQGSKEDKYDEYESWEDFLKGAADQAHSPTRSQRIKATIKDRFSRRKSDNFGKPEDDDEIDIEEAPHKRVSFDARIITSGTPGTSANSSTRTTPSHLETPVSPRAPPFGDNASRDLESGRLVSPRESPRRLASPSQARAAVAASRITHETAASSRSPWGARGTPRVAFVGIFELSGRVPTPLVLVGPPGAQGVKYVARELLRCPSSPLLPLRHYRAPCCSGLATHVLMGQKDVAFVCVVADDYPRGMAAVLLDEVRVAYQTVRPASTASTTAALVIKRLPRPGPQEGHLQPILKDSLQKILETYEQTEEASREDFVLRVKYASAEASAQVEALVYGGDSATEESRAMLALDLTALEARHRQEEQDRLAKQQRQVIAAVVISGGLTCTILVVIASLTAAGLV